MPDDAPKITSEAAESVRQEDTPEVGAGKPPQQPTAPAMGRRSSLRNIRIQLNDEELIQTGVQKLLIEGLDRAEAEIDRLNEYVKDYHTADKENATLKERLKINVVVEILSGTGLAVGSSIITLAPSLLVTDADKTVRTICIVVGLVILLGSIFAKYIQVKK